MTPRRTTDQAAETRALLVRAGRELFGTIGFAAAKASDIAQRAGVTRGALLHHFGDKEGLFASVLEEVEAESAARVLEAAITGPTRWSGSAGDSRPSSSNASSPTSPRSC